MAAEKRGDFVAVAADRHRAPAAAMRAGVVVEKKAAGKIGAAANRGAVTFDKEFRGGAGDGGKQPFETAFPGNEMKGPGAVVGDEFVVAFGDAKDFVDRFDPGGGESLSIDDRRENGAQGLPQAEDAQKHGVDGLRFRDGKRTKPGSAFLGD